MRKIHFSKYSLHMQQMLYLIHSSSTHIKIRISLRVAKYDRVFPLDSNNILIYGIFITRLNNLKINS